MNAYHGHEPDKTRDGMRYAEWSALPVEEQRRKLSLDAATRARARKLWGRRFKGWPYGAHFDLESRRLLLDWAEEHGLVPVNRYRACTHWLLYGRCQTRTCTEHIYGGWADHLSLWKAPDGRRLMLGQPYWPPKAEALPAGFPHVLRPEGGWYGHGTCWVEVWSQ